MTRLTYTTELVVITCWCGMPHAVPAALRDFQQREHDEGRGHSVYCPLGHQHQPAGKGKVELLQERLDRDRNERIRIQAELDQEKASHRSTKGQLTKTKKRVAGGACPCCNRTFVDVARHMKTKHPGYAADG